ncbi:MAG: hypothetical protein ACK4ZJ_18820, partial [Allorhizobium sp.]
MEVLARELSAARERCAAAHHDGDIAALQRVVSSLEAQVCDLAAAIPHALTQQQQQQQQQQMEKQQRETEQKHAAMAHLLDVLEQRMLATEQREREAEQREHAAEQRAERAEERLRRMEERLNRFEAQIDAAGSVVSFSGASVRGRNANASELVTDAPAASEAEVNMRLEEVGAASCERGRAGFGLEAAVA